MRKVATRAPCGQIDVKNPPNASLFMANLFMPLPRLEGSDRSFSNQTRKRDHKGSSQTRNRERDIRCTSNRDNSGDAMDAFHM